MLPATSKPCDCILIIFGPMSIYRTVLDVIERLHTDFSENELAYLAVTSKIENPLRDRIAFELHKRLGQQFLVHREWAYAKRSKADLAVTDDKNRVKYLFEFKAHSLPTYEQGYSDKIRLDLQKLYAASNEETESYFIYFLNHVKAKDLLDHRFQHVVKYHKYLNQALQLHRLETDISDKVTEYWHRHLEEVGMEKAKSALLKIEAGSYYDIPVSIFAFIYGPMMKTDIFNILNSGTAKDH